MESQIAKSPPYLQIFAHNPDMAISAGVKWTEAVAHLIANDWVTPGRLAIADRYARAYAEYEILYGEAIVDGPVKVSAQTGGEYFNYKWSAVEKLNERLAKFEAKLKIDPMDDAGAKPPPSKPTAADDYLD